MVPNDSGTCGDETHEDHMWLLGSPLVGSLTRLGLILVDD